jgi:hypothetical protein
MATDSTNQASRAQSSAAAPVQPLIPVPRKPRRLWVRITMIGGAVVLILLGLAATLLPIPAGFLFWIVGLLLLGVSVPAIGRWLNRQEAKLPPRRRRRLRPEPLLKLRRRLQKLR